jgi:hypothetical protein
MFGLINKKKRRINAAIEGAELLLHIQITLGDGEGNDEFNARLNRLYSRGYIFGLCDAELQAAGVEVEEGGLGLLATVHLRLFGNEKGVKIFAQSLRDEEDPTFRKGVMRGGNELVEFLRNKTPPMGLAGYLLTGET